MEATSFSCLNFNTLNYFPSTSLFFRENVRGSACVKARRSTPMRAMQEDELSTQTSPDSRTVDRDKLNQNRFVALFGRIQNLISEEQSKSKNDKSSSADTSVQEFLPQSTTKEDHEKPPAQKGRKPKKEKSIPDSLNNKLARPLSNFVKSSPIPSPTPLRRDQYTGADIEGSSSEASSDLEKFTAMKVSELKLLAKEIRIRGYSKLKKSELIELLRARV